MKQAILLIGCVALSFLFQSPALAGEKDVFSRFKDFELPVNIEAPKVKLVQAEQPAPPSRFRAFGRHRYIEVVTTKPVYGRIIDPRTGLKVHGVVGLREFKRTVRLTYNRQFGGFGFYQDGKFVLVEKVTPE